MISKPTLPPKAGYVEVVDADGNHVYKPTPETEAKLSQETQNSALKEKIAEQEALINALLGVGTV